MTEEQIHTGDLLSSFSGLPYGRSEDLQEIMALSWLIYVLQSPENYSKCHSQSIYHPLLIMPSSPPLLLPFPIIYKKIFQFFQLPLLEVIVPFLGTY